MKLRMEPPTNELWMCDVLGQPVSPTERNPINWKKLDRIARDDERIESARRHGNFRVGMKATSYERSLARASQK